MSSNPELRNVVIFLALSAVTFAVMFYLVGASFSVSLICAVSIMAVGISRAIAARDKKANGPG